MINAHQQFPSHVLASVLIRRIASILFKSSIKAGEPDPADALMVSWMKLRGVAEWIEKHESLQFPTQVREDMIGGIRTAHALCHEDQSPWLFRMADCGCAVADLNKHLAHLQIMDLVVREGATCAA